jgi:RNA 2',3'-cyclic 3'-phosphodiesterase
VTDAPGAGGPRHRLFFALWPSARAAEALARQALAMAARHGGRPMPAEKIHLTLAFLGDVAQARAADAMEAARVVGPRSFMVRLDRLGGFRRSKVGWAGMSRPPEALLELQSELESGLKARGFALEERPFAPHVTLVRKVERPVAAEAMEAIAWKARAIGLVLTQPGTGRYLRLAET